MTETALFALTLEQMEGVGRVTAGRILSHFETYEDLLRYPREQVLLRIKGAPNAQALVERLLDQKEMQGRMDKLRELVPGYRQRQIQILDHTCADWPHGLAALPRGNRPNILYAYGHTSILNQPGVAIFGQDPIGSRAFETAQALVRHLMKQQIITVAGSADGFDVVMHRICATTPDAHPSVMTAACGLARLERKMRPHASATVKAGGLLISSFPLTHGPFPHDDRERALVQAAVSRAAVFFEPQPGAPAWTAMEWALESHRAVFGMASDQYPLPGGVHPLQQTIDFDWVVAAALHTS